MPVANQKRFLIFVGICVLALLVVVAAVASSAPSATKPKPTTTPTPTILVTPTPAPPPTISCTIKSAVGIQSVQITNQNTGASWVFTPIDLPTSFNVKNGDTLTFKVNAAVGYKFNYWIFGDNTIQSQNPYTIKLTASLSMDARFLMVVQTG